VIGRIGNQVNNGKTEVQKERCMIPSKELVEEFEGWMAKIDAAIGDKDGSMLCEATRMALAYALILHTDYPDELTVEMGKQMKERFTKALGCVTEVLGQCAEENGPDGCYDPYERNIQERLRRFEEWSSEWWKVTVPR